MASRIQGLSLIHIFYDEDNSDDEDRYNTIGDTSAGRISQKTEGALIRCV